MQLDQSWTLNSVQLLRLLSQLVNQKPFWTEFVTVVRFASDFIETCVCIAVAGFQLLVRLLEDRALTKAFRY
jgi:hypothetical protein